VFEGLKYVWNIGFRRVELHIDSQVVVKMIQDNISVGSSCWSLVCQIHRLIEHDWEIRIEHSYRETNKYVNMLANIGCDTRGL
jgi:ribonuclease HI